MTYWFTCVVLLICVAVGSDFEVQRTLATALAFALPVLIGGEAILDARARKTETIVALAEARIATGMTGDIHAKAHK